MSTESKFYPATFSGLQQALDELAYTVPLGELDEACASDTSRRAVIVRAIGLVKNVTEMEGRNRRRAAAHARTIDKFSTPV